MAAWWEHAPLQLPEGAAQTVIISAHSKRTQPASILNCFPNPLMVSSPSYTTVFHKSLNCNIKVTKKQQFYEKQNKILQNCGGNSEEPQYLVDLSLFRMFTDLRQCVIQQKAAASQETAARS